MLEARGLTKRYGGFLALDRVDFQVRRGEILGYLGPNGSGKSTTVNTVVGLIDPSAGSLWLDGAPIARRPGRLQAPDRIRAGRAASLHPPDGHRVPDAGRPAPRPDRRTLAEKIPALLQLLLLWDSRYATMAAYSKGMRQRVLFAAALMHNPDLLVLDEPFSGLDVTASLLFRTLLRMFAAGDRMVLFSTHRFDMVEKLCSRVVILSKGRVAAERDMASFRDERSAITRRRLRPDDRAGRLHAGRPPDPRPDATVTTDDASSEWRRRFTERAEWRLTEHFFRAMFDFGFLSDLAADSFKRVLIGSVGGFVAFGLLLTRTYMVKYAVLWSTGTRRTVPAGAARRRHDDHRPPDAARRVRHTARQPRAVSGRARLPHPRAAAGAQAGRLPRKARRLADVHRAVHVAAHVSLVAAHAAHVAEPVGRTAASSCGCVAWAIASVTASAFAVLAITAVVGVLVLALSRSRMQALSTFMRSMVLGLLVVCLPLVSHLPALGAPLSRGEPGWCSCRRRGFSGFSACCRAARTRGSFDSALIGLAAVLVAAIVAVTYIVLFRQFERLMLRPAPTSPPWWRRIDWQAAHARPRRSEAFSDSPSPRSAAASCTRACSSVCRHAGWASPRSS